MRINRWTLLFIGGLCVYLGLGSWHVVSSRSGQHAAMSLAPADVQQPPTSMINTPLPASTALPIPSTTARPTPPTPGTATAPSAPSARTRGRMNPQPGASDRRGLEGQNREGSPARQARREAMQTTFGLVRLFRQIGRLAEEGSTTPLTPAQARAILSLMTPLRTQATLTPAQATAIRETLDAELTPAQREAIAQLPDRRRGGFGGRGPGGPDGENSGPGANGGNAPDGERPRWGDRQRTDASTATPGAGSPRPQEDVPGPGMTGSPSSAGDRAPGATPRREGAGADGAGRGGPPPMLRNFNPFNPPADNPMAARMAERWTTIFAALEAKATAR
jgi:hypothetical protein